MAEAFEVEHGNAFPLEANEAFALQRLQALVGRLARDAGQKTEIFLADLKMRSPAGKEDRVKKPIHTLKD
jgi:hypothetical protein